MIIKMRDKNYKLDTKECEYEISVTPENVLVMKRGELIFLTVHLDNFMFREQIRCIKPF